MYLRRNRTIYIVAGITDMRKQINGLSAIAQDKESEAIFTGAYFVFMGKTRHVMKILYWDKTGFCLVIKRLEEDTFPSERKRIQGPLLEQMHEWLVARSASVAPLSSLGKAISYALGQWDHTLRYLNHVLLTPDNNAVENAIRPFVVGRKNWLFSNTPSGVHTSAGLYSLIETAKANGHESYKYLCYLFDALPKAKTLEERVALLPYRLVPSCKRPILPMLTA